MLGDGDDILLGVRIPPSHECHRPRLRRPQRRLAGQGRVRRSRTARDGCRRRMRRLSDDDPDTMWSRPRPLPKPAPDRRRHQHRLDDGAALRDRHVAGVPSARRVGRAAASVGREERPATASGAMPTSQRWPSGSSRPRSAPSSTTLLHRRACSSRSCGSAATTGRATDALEPGGRRDPVDGLDAAQDPRRHFVARRCSRISSARFVTFCHRERGIRATLTGETLTSIAHFEPAYLEIIGAAEEPLLRDAWYEAMLGGLREAVGGGDVLQELDVEPLPDEPLRVAQHPGGRARSRRRGAGAVRSLCPFSGQLGVPHCVPSLPGHRCAWRPERVPAQGTTPETGAAAVCWAVGKANDLFSISGDGIYVKELMEHFGLKESSSVSQRAATMLRAGGFSSETDQLSLGSPQYLISACAVHKNHRSV